MAKRKAKANATTKAKAKSEAPKHVVNKTAVNAICKALDNAYGVMAASGSLVHSCVQVARKYYNGKAIHELDREAIVDRLAQARKWKKESERIRRNEAHSILKAYPVLPELIKRFSKSNSGLCAWHEVVSLSRKFVSEKSVAKAVAAVRKRPSATVPPNKLPTGEAKRQAAIAIKRILKMTRGLSKDFRAELAELCTENGIRV